jgi:uncharacterized membrane protein YqgA involved in biofilm formation
MIGLGTLVNVVTILVGASLGVLLGNRLPARTNAVITDALGLVTIVLGGLNVIALNDKPLVTAVGSAAPLLIVLGSLLIGGVAGSLLGIERRLEGFGAWLQARFSKDSTDGGKARFIQGFVSSSLVFVIGPLAILGALSDGLGNGIDQLALKSTLDGFAALAFAASLGWGVAASALPVAIWQGGFTLAAVLLGSLMPDATVSAITATGGVLLLGVGIRLLGLKQISVADLLPALLVAPLLTTLVAQFV